MAVTQLLITIDNISIDNSIASPIRTTKYYPIINWSYDRPNILDFDEYGTIENLEEIGQKGYELRIATNADNLGTDEYIGNRVDTRFITSKDRFWQYRGYPLERGERYYGQLYVEDDNSISSSWYTFSFQYNSLPIVSRVLITPQLPTVDGNLSLSYNFYDTDGDIETGTKTRWFKNGIHQRSFDNSSVIQSSYLQLGDEWIADVLPSDGYEFGERISSPMVIVSQSAVTLSDIRILPDNANENDMLKADYLTSDIFEEDNVNIRWFINNVLQTDYNDSKFLRIGFSSGDTVRYEIKSQFGTGYYSSSTITIQDSDFVVYDINIDSQKASLEVSSLVPVIRWKMFAPDSKSVRYTSIKIGTFYEANNVYSTLLESDRDTFSIPPNILERGRDYYLSIAVSDTNSFNKYESVHFRVINSRWKQQVSNVTGWTIQVAYIIETIGSFDKERYQVVRIADGTKFAEIRIYNDKIGLVSDTVILSDSVTSAGFNSLTILGDNNNIKIYLENELIIDGTNLFIQSTTEKDIAIGNNIAEDFVVKYKYFNYTVSGFYEPGISSEFSNIKFHNYMEFDDSEIVALKQYSKNDQDFKMFGVNPANSNESGAIFSIVPGVSYENDTVNRTFAPINRIRRSPDNKKMAVAHSRGLSIIDNYVIGSFDNSLDFIVNNNIIYQDPTSSGWALIQNTGRSGDSYFDTSGFNINTSYRES